MTKQDIEAEARSYFENSEDRFVPSGGIYAQGIEGMPIFDRPIFAYAAADDSLFECLKDISVVGPHHRSPNWWLPEAKSVISFFLPFSEDVKRGNSLNAEWPANSWYHARIEGQRFMLGLAFHVADVLGDAGYACSVPDSRELPERADKRFKMCAVLNTPEGEHKLFFTSNWSERHAAFISGLGTFSLSRNLITEKGCAGRVCSIITELELTPTRRAFTDIYEYCSRCGSCIKRCPAQAITQEEGKDQKKCKQFLDSTKTHPPYYGCGKCQVSVPCESCIPGR